MLEVPRSYLLFPDISSFIGWMFCALSPKFIYWNPSPQSDDAGGGAFRNGQCLLRGDITAQSLSFCSLPCEGAMRIYKPRQEHSSTRDMLIPWCWTCQSSEQWEITVSCLNHLV